MNETLMVGDSSSNAAYRSATASRLGSNMRRRRTNAMVGDHDTSSRVSGNRNSSMHGGGRGASIATGVSNKNKDKKTDNSYINKEIDYFNKLEIVEKTIEATGYIPRAMRDQKSVIKLSDMRCSELDKEE